MSACAAESSRVMSARQSCPGDHAFVAYADDESHWEIMTAFAWSGLARDEQVTLFAAPEPPEGDALGRPHAPGPPTTAARRRGQLVLSGMRALVAPQRDLTPRRRLGRSDGEVVRATHDGHTGFRAVIDTRSLPDLNTDLCAVIRREPHARRYFTQRWYSELRAYDHRRFTPDVLGATAAAHPRTPPGRLGGPRARHAPAAVHLVGASTWWVRRTRPPGHAPRADCPAWCTSTTRPTGSPWTSAARASRRSVVPSSFPPAPTERVRDSGWPSGTPRAWPPHSASSARRRSPSWSWSR